MNDLQSFVTVAEEKSFTRAATKLGISPSALSHAMRTLEARLGVRLLARTTRSVSTTDAGERLLTTLRPAFEDIATGLSALGALREKPSGNVRITTCKHAASSVLMPVVPAFLDAHPDVRVEIAIDDPLTDIVATRYDAGIRWPDKIEKDMVAVTVGPPIQLAVVGSPAYFAKHPPPKTPRDLQRHRCINYRNPSTGALHSWELERDGRVTHVKVDGQLIGNDGELTLRAAVDGVGLAMYYEDEVAPLVEAGRLMRVLTKWCPPLPGYQLYYPSRRHVPPALAALIAALRKRASPPSNVARVVHT